MDNRPQKTPKKGPERARLGINAKTANAPIKTRDETRRELFRAQRQVAALLPKERVHNCRWAVAANAAGVVILRNHSEDGIRARFAGLQTCGSVWHCPICSRNISETRRRELNAALASARAQKLAPMLMTLTFSHGKGERLDDLLKAIRAARKHFTNSRAWKAVKPIVVGTVAALEITHGANGWHPHFHILLFVDHPDPAELAGIKGLGDQWRASLRSQGRVGKGAAFDLDTTSGSVGNYVAKWGAAEELTLRDRKTGKGRNPWDILSAASAGEPGAGSLFQEYAVAFKGARQLVWSKGLKDRLGVDLTDDKDASESGDLTSLDVSPPTNHDERLAYLPTEDWKKARKRGRPAILAAAEIPNADDALDALTAVINGPTLEKKE